MLLLRRIPAARSARLRLGGVYTGTETLEVNEGDGMRALSMVAAVVVVTAVVAQAAEGVATVGEDLRAAAGDDTNLVPK